MFLDRKTHASCPVLMRHHSVTVQSTETVVHSTLQRSTPLALWGVEGYTRTHTRSIITGIGAICDISKGFLTGKGVERRGVQVKYESNYCRGNLLFLFLFTAHLRQIHGPGLRTRTQNQDQITAKWMDLWPVVALVKIQGRNNNTVLHRKAK